MWHGSFIHCPHVLDSIVPISKIHPIHCKNYITVGQKKNLVCIIGPWSCITLTLKGAYIRGFGLHTFRGQGYVWGLYCPTTILPFCFWQRSRLNQKLRSLNQLNQNLRCVKKQTCPTVFSCAMLMLCFVFLSSYVVSVFPPFCCCWYFIVLVLCFVF